MLVFHSSFYPLFPSLPLTLQYITIFAHTFYHLFPSPTSRQPPSPPFLTNSAPPFNRDLSSTLPSSPRSPPSRIHPLLLPITVLFECRSLQQAIRAMPSRAVAILSTFIASTLNDSLNSIMPLLTQETTYSKWLFNL